MVSGPSSIYPQNFKGTTTENADPMFGYFISTIIACMLHRVWSEGLFQSQLAKNNSKQVTECEFNLLYSSNNSAMRDSNVCPHKLLTPTMPSLLLQAARGIDSGYSCWLLAIIGSGGLRSVIHGKAWGVEV